MRPNSSSCLPSTNWRSSSVSEAHFCFSLPLVMFQSPLISSVVMMILDLLFSFLFAANVAERCLRCPGCPCPLYRGLEFRPRGAWSRLRFGPAFGDGPLTYRHE